MSYNNLLYLLVVIFLLSARQSPSSPHFSPALTLLIFLLKLGILHLICARLYRRGRAMLTKDYFRAEKVAALAAIVSLALDIFWLDGLYYFSHAPFAHTLPLVARLVGLSLFFFYLSIGWYFTARCLGTYGRPQRFVVDNLQATVPIVLPWIFISLVFDLLSLSSSGPLHHFLAGQYGEIVVLGFFFFFLAIIYPPLLMRLWHCTPLPSGAVRDELESMCAAQHLGYKDIMLWPLLGGQAVTAGVIGFLRRFRYVLVTPALLQSLTLRELEAVFAHEIGHVKRFHMQLYLLLLIGFSVIVDPALDLILYGLVQSDFLVMVADRFGVTSGQVIEGTTTVLMLVFLVVFLRFVFGFFMRNFERQADLHAFTSMANSLAISDALEKVARLSGDIRDLPNWHHFGIGQRVTFLQECAVRPALVGRHHRKVYLALGSYIAAVLVAIMLHFSLPGDLLTKAVENREIQQLTLLLQEGSDNLQLAWALGDLHYNRKEYGEAIDRYNDALNLHADNAEVLNNLAWLLVTCEDERFLDGPYALLLARQAVRLSRLSHILDTLAHVYWFLDRRQEAIEVQSEAIDRAHPRQKNQYQRTLAGWLWLMEKDGQLHPESVAELLGQEGEMDFDLDAFVAGE